MPTTLPPSPRSRTAPNTTLGRAVRFFWLLGRSRWLHNRLEAAHRRMDQVGTDEAGDELLRAAERWLVCHEEIGALLNLPAPAHVEEMRAVLTGEPSRLGMEDDRCREVGMARIQRGRTDILAQRCGVGVASRDVHSENPMTYTLRRLAPGSFELNLDGEVVGSIVREVSKDGYEGDWIVETLIESAPYPAPFTAETHKFGTLKAAADWLEAEVPDL